LEVGVFSRQGELMWSRHMPPEVGHVCVPTNLRNCYAVKVRPAARVSDRRLGDDASAEPYDASAVVYDTRAEAYEWSERILLPLRSQPSSVEWCLVTCLPEGAVYDAAELDLSVTSEAGAQGLIR
jgi:hypothetical protein